MWDTLSKYLNSTDPVNQQALHNIAVMVEAYMTHQNERPHLDEVDYHQEKKKDKISEVLTKIRKLLGDENATEKVKEMVLQNFKPEYDDNTECKQTNEDNLLSSIDLSYKNYLDNAKCRGDYDTGLLRGKALLRNGAPMKPKYMSGRQFYDTYVVHKNVLDEADASAEFYKGRIPANKRYKKRGRFNRWINRRGFGRSAKLGRYARQFKKRHTGLRRRPKKSSKNRPKKTHIRSDEACVKYANRKFLITLRTSIERFMDLRDCHQDDTLRTSNKNRKAINRRRKQALPTSNKRKFNDMTFYTDTELGEKEQRRINNYLSNIKDFNNQEINRNKSIFIVHTTSYKSPLLLKLNNKQEGIHGYTSNMKQPLERPSYNNQQSKYSFDNIYKSFLESSDKDSFDTLHSKKTLVGDSQSRHREGRIRDINLYDIIKQKVDQEKNKHLFGTVGRQNDVENAPLDVEPILYNNASDDASPNNTSDTNLAQNGTSINFEEIGSMLDEVRNSTLQKPQIDASNFVSNNDKGYVELSYLVKYPKSIVFRPQYLVKNILQYEEFVKVASQLYVTDEDKQLMKIVRYLPDNKTQILFETQDFKSPIEVFDVKEDIKKIKPIFSANFSDSNEALRQRTTNETDIYNFENENETQINVLPKDRINVDSPLRENNHVNSQPEDNVSTGHIIADAFTEDTINTDISNIEPLREDNFGVDITRTETLTEDEIHTDLTNEDSQPENSSSTDVSYLFKDDVVTSDNDREETKDLFKTGTNNINLLRDSKMNIDINKLDHLQEDNIAEVADRAEILPEEKNDSQVIRDNNINAYVSETDILRNDNIIIDDNQIDHLSDDIINSGLNGVDSLRDTKMNTYTNMALGLDSLQEGEDRTSTEHNIAHFLQETKINYDVDHTDLLRENNISTVDNRADLVLEDKITSEDSKVYLNSDTGLREIDLLRQKKISPDAHVDLLQENTKLNKDDSTDNNEQHLPEGNSNMDLSRIESLQEDKIITDDNPSDSFLETNTEEHIADSLRESNIDIDVDRAHLVSEDNIKVEDVTGLLLEGNTEVNDVYSLRESTISTEVNRETSQLENKNDTEIAYVALRDDKIITEISQEDALQQEENSTEDSEYPPNETKIGLYLNILNNLHNSKKDSAVSYGDTMPENNINAVVNRVDLQREDIGSIDGNLDKPLLKDIEDSDTHTLRDSRITTDSNKADSMPHDDIIIHSVELLSGDKTSTEENMAESLQQIKVNHGVNFAHLLREHNNTTKANRQDLLKENKTNTEEDNTDYLRENKILVSEYPRGQKESIKAEINREDPIPEEKIENVDSLRANKISPYIKHEDSLLKDSIITEDHNASQREIQTQIDYTDSLRENQISPYTKHDNYLQKDSIITEDNSADQSEIQAQIDYTDSLRENQISPYINHENSLQNDLIIAEENSDQSESQTQIDHTDSLRENPISPYIKHENSLQKHIIITEDNSTAQDETQTQIDDADSLRENQISPYINHENSFQNDLIITEENSDQKESQTQIDHTDSLRENPISPYIKHENSLQKDIIISKDNSTAQDETQTQIDDANTLRENQISPYINHENSSQNDLIITEENSDQSESQAQIDHAGSLRENPISPYIKHENSLLKDIIITKDPSTNSTAQDETQTQIDDADSLRENQISPHINHENSLQNDLIITEENSDQSESQTQIDHTDSLRENPISPYIKHENSLQKHIIITKDNSTAQNETQTQINDADSLRENQISPYINHENSLQNDLSITEENSDQSESQTQIDHTDSLRENPISPYIKHENSLQKDIIITKDNAAQVETQTQIDDADSLRENKISPEIRDENSLQKENISTDNISGDTLAEDINQSKLDNGGTLRESIIIRDVDENFSVEVKRNYPLAEDKITDVDNVNSLQESANTTDANNVNLLRGDTITTDSNRDDSLLENSESNEFNYGNEYLPLGAAGQLRNSKTNAEFGSADHLQEENLHSDIIYSKDKISTEVNEEDLLKERNIDPTDNQADRFYVGTTNTEAFLLEDIISQKLSDPLRERDTNHDIHSDNVLLEDKHSTEINSNEYHKPEEVDHLRNSKFDTDFKDPLREDNMRPEVSPADLPKNKISIEVSQENINNEGNSVDPLRQGKTSSEFNRSDLLPVDEINQEVVDVDPLQDIISSESNRGDTLREGISSTMVNRAKLFPEETINTDLIHNIPSYEAEIASDVTSFDSMSSDDVSNDDIRSDTLPKDISTPEYNNKNILRVGNVSTDVNREDSLIKDKIDTEVSNENSMQEDKVSSAINNGDPLLKDILKKNLRDDEIILNVTRDKIDMDDKTDINVSNLLPKRKDKTNTELNYENPLPIDKASEEISSVTALRDKGGFNVPDHSEGEEVSTDDYRVNPLLKDILGHDIDNSDSSHVDLLSGDKINKDITRVDTLPGEEKNRNTYPADIIQEDTTITDVNTKGSLRETNIDNNVKLTEDLPEEEPNTGLNRDSLEEDQVSTSVIRSDPLPENKIEIDNLNLDALKEPRNYTEELDYLTYQDGFIADGLNISSNEFKRGGSSVKLPNPVLNETSYKYNASSALREQVIDAFNDTLNSSEFINRKDDVNLNELNKNISLPDIDAESIADYLRFTLNNAEASLSTASQAYLKELETQGITNAAATKLLLKNWWDAWKNKLTTKVQSIAGRVTNLFKKLDNTSLSNEEPAIKEEFGDM